MPDTLAELVRRWRVTEQQLYPMILADPVAYQRLVLAVRGLADDLAVVASPEALVEAYASSAPQAAEHLRSVGGPDDPAAAELVAGAAFALRERELSAAMAADGRARRLAEAARSGAAWVVVQQAGERAMAVFGNYRRLEMHLPEGTGLYSYAESRVETDRPLYVVEKFRLSPVTGTALGEAEQRWTFEDPVAWNEALDALRHELDRAPAASP
ncbi:MAG TPA: hypothetical protein VET24_14855 [Actinomycetota bacterium]|nr:hypothetical protein [Actinomycetota bacterium]